MIRRIVRIPAISSIAILISSIAILIFPLNFLDFGSDTIENQEIIKLSSYSSKSNISVVF